jgi:hypothetical protein
MKLGGTYQLEFRSSERRGEEAGLTSYKHLTPSGVKVRAARARSRFQLSPLPAGAATLARTRLCCYYLTFF